MPSRTFDKHYSKISSDDDDLDDLFRVANSGISIDDIAAQALAALDDDDETTPRDRSKIVSVDASDASKYVSPQPSKNVSGRVRRSPANDAKIIGTMRSIRVADDSSVSPSSVGDSSLSISTPRTTPLPANDNLPVWSKTGVDVTAVCATVALLIADTPPIAFSFNLTPDAIERALAHPAGFLDALKRPFDQNLRRAGISLPYFFAIDTDEDGRLHIHGGFSYPDQTMSIGMTRRIRAIMKKSWGEWVTPGKHKQVHFQRLRDDEWADYCMKRRSKVSKIIGDRTFTISQPLRTEAEWSYNEIRRIIRDEPTSRLLAE